MAAAGRSHRVGRRPGSRRIARGEGGERPGRGTHRRTSAHDRAGHARVDRAPVPRHPPHHRHARAHRYDLLGATGQRRSHAFCRRTSRYSLVLRRGSGQAPATDEPRGAVVLLQSDRGNLRLKPAIPVAAPRNADHVARMNSNRVKAGVFVLEGLNSLSVTLYLYYIFFFTQTRFGFTSQRNLVLAATVGFVYIFASVCGGRFGQRHGYFAALRVGFPVMAGALLVGLWVENVAAHLILFWVYTAGTC